MLVVYLPSVIAQLVIAALLERQSIPPQSRFSLTVQSVIVGLPESRHIATELLDPALLVPVIAQWLIVGAPRSHRMTPRMSPTRYCSSGMLPMILHP